jgi:hypothetical protein
MKLWIFVWERGQKVLLGERCRERLSRFEDIWSPRKEIDEILMQTLFQLDKYVCVKVKTEEEWHKTVKKLTITQSNKNQSCGHIMTHKHCSSGETGLCHNRCDFNSGVRCPRLLVLEIRLHFHMESVIDLDYPQTRASLRCKGHSVCIWHVLIRLLRDIRVLCDGSLLYVIDFFSCMDFLSWISHAVM